MPHLRLETTVDLPENERVSEILAELTAELCRFETISPAAVKAVHIPRESRAVGEGHPAGFAHLEVAVLAGRSPELLGQIADGMYARLRAAFATSVEYKRAKTTLEVRQMDASTYRKES